MAALRRVLVAMLVASLLMAALVIGLIAVYTWERKPLPLSDQCTAHVADMTVSITTEQAANASIIVGVATQRGLAPRASTIALATVYQESGMRNIDYGDRDSLGLFQQRPSQGWGTAAQVQDPYYAAGAFFDVLVTIDGWRSGNINDVAQAVQRSGHPNGYAKHVENARRLASALAGETPASFTCLVKEPQASNPAGMAAFLERTLPADTFIAREPGSIVVEARTTALAWSAAHIAIANAGTYGLSQVDVGSRTWTASATSLAAWTGDPSESTTVVLHFPETTPTPSPEG